LFPVSIPVLAGREKELISQCIDTGWISSDGPFVKDFETKFSRFVDCNFGVAVCNGTAALEAAMFAVGIKPGDEVILPSFTIISCAIAIRKFGGIPILVDIQPDTWCMDPSLIKGKLTKNTKAILAVHMYGHACDMEAICEIAHDNDLLVIEDASQVHGAEYKGRKCGSLGDVATFSFYANKIITTGEGGMVVTNKKNLAERAESYRNLCFQASRRFLHNEWGANLRMTNMQAAIGLAQLERVDQILEAKIRNGKLYKTNFDGCFGLQLQIERQYVKQVYWMYCVQLSPKLGLDAEFVIKKLAEKKIGCRPFFLGLHSQPVMSEYTDRNCEKFPVTEKASRYGFYLPSSINLSIEDIATISKSLTSIVKTFGKVQ